METSTFKLSKPITTHKGERAELTLAPPTAALFIDHGSPYSFDKNNNVVPDWKAIFGFLSEMSGVDTLLLRSVPGADAMPLFYKLMDMLSVHPTTGSEPSTP